MNILHMVYVLGAKTFYSYCNSVMQCLYFSPAFRENVISFPFPKRRPNEPVQTRGLQEAQTDPLNLDHQNHELSSSLSAKSSLGLPKISIPQKPATSYLGPASHDSQSEQTKESFDNRKKQVMASGPHIRMESSGYEDYGMPESLFTGMKDIFEAVVAHQSRIGVIVPTKFLEVLRANNESYRGTIHQDAHEFLNLLLNEVVEQVEEYTRKELNVIETGTPVDFATSSHSDLPFSPGDHSTVKPRLNSSWVHELFEGTLTSETRCLTCENVSQRDEIFLDLSVDIEEHTSVTSSLTKFSAEEMLCERNKFHCDKCGGLQEAEKRMKIKRLPRILALHLKRFKFLEEENRLAKLFYRVKYPFQLRLFNTTDDAEDPDRLYELYAVIVHLGATPFHGHYVAIIKTQERRWLLFDDELVIPVDANYVRNYFGTGDQRNPACAYVLFYQETTIEAVYREQDAESPTADELSVVPAEQTISPVIPGDTTSPILDPAMRVQSPPTIDQEGVPEISSKTTPVSSHDTSLQSSLPAMPKTGSARKSEELFKDELTTEDSGRPRLSADQTQAASEDKPTSKDSSRFHSMRSGMSRFRNSSLSLRTRPKLFGSKDHARESNEDQPIVSGDNQAATGTEKQDKQEKTKTGLFGLSRKKSAQLL